MKRPLTNPAMPAIDAELALHRAKMRAGAKLPQAKRKTL